MESNPIIIVVTFIVIIIICCVFYKFVITNTDTEDCKNKYEESDYKRVYDYDDKDIVKIGISLFAITKDLESKPELNNHKKMKSLVVKSNGVYYFNYNNIRYVIFHELCPYDQIQKYKNNVSTLIPKLDIFDKYFPKYYAGRKDIEQIVIVTESNSSFAGIEFRKLYTAKKILQINLGEVAMFDWKYNDNKTYSITAEGDIYRNILGFNYNTSIDYENKSDNVKIDCVSEYHTSPYYFNIVK